MKMPTKVGIFIFISRENFMLSWVEHEKSFITSESSHCAKPFQSQKILNMSTVSSEHFFCSWSSHIYTNIGTLQLLTILVLTFELPGPEVIKLFSCSTQLSTKFFMLMNLKLLTMPNSFLLNIAEHENISANKYENANNSWHFLIY